MPDIDSFKHHAMATYFQVRIANQERTYAAQAAQTSFELLDRLESQLSRFRTNSDIARIAHLAAGDKMRLSEPAFACLRIAKRMEEVTNGAFSATPRALQTQASMSQWELSLDELSIRCLSGELQFDLGAIGKGFALDRMADLLRDWDCTSFLLVAGGSSIVAGDPPDDAPGWSCGLGEHNASQRFFLKHASLSGSGLGVQGEHILDPRTGRPAWRKDRAWILADTGAESDALSTACMVLSPSELAEVLAQNDSWLAFIAREEGIHALGNRVPPVPA